MDTASQTEKNRDRVEKRSAFITNEIGWLAGREEWAGLSCIGAVHTEFETKRGKTEEWHYYISGRKLTVAELLHHVCMEWTVETMHWLLDVHFGEDYCWVEDQNIQQNLNMLRKAAINLILLPIFLKIDFHGSFMKDDLEISDRRIWFQKWRNFL